MTGPADRRCDLAIVGGRVLSPEASSDTRDGWTVLIDDGVIVDVLPDAAARVWHPRRQIDAGGAVVAPGFVDAHVHLGAHLGAARPYRRADEPSPFSGEADVDVLAMVATFCAAKVPSEVSATVLRPVFASMLKAGFTGVVDAGGPGAAGAVQAASDMGIRAAIGPSLADRWADSSGQIVEQANADELLEAAADFVERHDLAGRGRVRALVSAVDPMGCSDQLLAGIAALAARADVPTHVHSNITADHDREHVALTGRTLTERLDAAALLTERCTIMHAGSLSDRDIDRYVSAGLTVNHAPVGNALYGFGTSPEESVPRLLDAGVPIVLGTDWAPSVTSPFELIRAALMLQRDRAGTDVALTLEQALTMATNGSASLGRAGQLGSIEPGQLADIVVVDTTGSHHLASVHPVPALTLHGRACDVRTVVVAGEVIVDGGELVGHDEVELLSQARKALATLS